MPTVLRIGALRFHFYASDVLREPAHVHVVGPEGECKFWLDPVSLAEAFGFRPVQLRDIERLVVEHRQVLVEGFHEFRRRTEG